MGGDHNEFTLSVLLKWSHIAVRSFIAEVLNDWFRCTWFYLHIAYLSPLSDYRYLMENAHNLKFRVLADILKDFFSTFTGMTIINLEFIRPKNDASFENSPC